MAQPSKKPAAKPWWDSMYQLGAADFRKLLDKKKKEERGAFPSLINFQDEDKNTALHTACKGHRADVVAMLLAERADPNLEDANKFTPLLVACGEDSNEEVIKLLLTAPGIDVTARNVDGTTALHYFAKTYNSPNSAEVFQMLLQRGAGVNDVNHKGETPLLLSVLPLKNNVIRPATTRLLLQAGADVNIASNAGDLPMHWAVMYADQELISMMLERGGDPTARTRRDNKTPAEIAAESKRPNIASMLKHAENRWTKQKELEVWLSGIGLSKFLPQFKKEEFDMSSISEINDGVLLALGLPQGARLTFLKAQREYLESQGQTLHKPSMSSSSASIPTSGSGPTGDRKATSTLLPSTHIISYSDITLGRLLGKGFFAEVREGEYRGSPIAVKIIYRESFRNKGDIELFYQEAEILSKLRFPTVVQFIGICVGEQHCIITEYMKDGSLYQKLHDYPDDILRAHKWQLQIALDIARGMNYLHGLNPPVVHRDLTSKNILLDGKLAKVADFGLSKEKEAAATMTASVGALPWVAPEVFKGAQFTESADTYSYGVILWELWSGKDPQGDLAPLAFANKVAHEAYRPIMATHTPAAIKELIVRCWDDNPKKRPNFDEILKYLKAYEASGHDRHSSSKSRDNKEKREKSGKKSSSKPPSEPAKASSEVNLLAAYGGGAPSLGSSDGAGTGGSDSALLASYGQPDQSGGAVDKPNSGDMYINSTGFGASKAQSNPESGSHDWSKSMSADQLRKHSDSELTGSRGKNEILLKGSGSSTASQSEGDLVSSGKLRFSAPDNPIPTIAVPPAAPATSSTDSGSGGRTITQSAKLQKDQLRQFHERYGNGPVIFHNPSAPKSKDASPTHLRRVSMDDGNRSPLKDKEGKNGGDSPKSSKP